MKNRSWIILLGLVLAVGVSASTFAQDRKGDHHGKGNDHHKGKDDHGDHAKASLAQHITKVTKADSIQAAKMKPTIDKASKRLEALKLAYQKQEKKVMDSLKVQLKPYLKEDQQKELNDYIDNKSDHKKR